MDFESFEASLGGNEPPPDLSPALQALWQQRRGDWHAAHRLAQSQNDPIGAWVHAHLHRVEGDDGNAAYWYRRAGKPVSAAALEEEWAAIVRALLADVDI